ncbi:uncharacterized protein PHACADRAFT_96628 [Phanerochaete carnosa HHB-10118-sp]|uniref:PPM-type phosphatase domain-containing protein n=1 Tax=Phanerochaete carnosa (strain HHB-10118-sp) TaxID=650164 RepID=K5VSA4_PHACS|nr:uncharacterized protein PHACADRAFT_96628 [Phanerochaete carnosa HHB-10118-sp]EKM54353.1 hypothetical protein PHACADRAFT_96628 [Phanerochaete carnosa HHB-10118-sp]
MFQGQRAQSDNGWTGYGGPWPYTILKEPELSYHLERLSVHRTVCDVDVVSFQPYPALDHNQDRYFIEDWIVRGQTWRFFSLFDGHSDSYAVEHAVRQLPSAIKQSLAYKAETGQTSNPVEIETLLRRSISTFDNEMTQELLDLFPGGVEAIAEMSDDEIRALVVVDSRPHPVVARCMGGTTALVALVDPARNLYVASLGDCVACEDSNGEQWTTTILSSNHNASDVQEAQRVRSEHPGEMESVVNNRVCGVIAVTRAIGDHAFKLPMAYADRVFRLADPGAYILKRLDVLRPRHHTPPYLSNTPDVQHISLSAFSSHETVLILATDGLVDISKAHEKALSDVAPHWVSAASRSMDNKPALRLLRAAMGGEDTKQVSFWLTVEMDVPWVDDTTILVTRV